jgi:Spy/CpxP family protein refolding chaperone
MLRNVCAALAVATLALAAGLCPGTADEPRGESANRHDRMEALAHKLGLNDQQKEEIRKIHIEFDKQADPIEHELWELAHQEHEAMGQVLSEEQRRHVPELLKAMRERELQKVGEELGLSEEQKQRIEKTCEQYEMKFHDLAMRKERGENAHRQFREMRREFLSAIRPELNEEQRAKLPMIIREEHRYWHNPTVRREHLKAMADKLGVSSEQREQLEKIYSEYEPKVDKILSQLKQVHHEEHTAFAKVLTPEQRTKLQELHKNR